jgi:hypothetical protein
MTGVALDHHRRRLEGSVGDLSHGELLVVMVSLLNRDDRRVRGEDEVDAGVRHEVGELSDIDVESVIEAVFYLTLALTLNNKQSY